MNKPIYLFSEKQIKMKLFVCILVNALVLDALASDQGDSKRVVRRKKQLADEIVRHFYFVI